MLLRAVLRSWMKLQSLLSEFSESRQQMCALECCFQVWLSHSWKLSIKTWKSLSNSNESHWKMQSFVGGTQVFGIQRLNFSSGPHCHFWQKIIVSRGKALNTLVSWLMKKVTSVLPCYPDLLSPQYRRRWLTTQLPNPPPPLFSEGFNPHPQVKTISSFISLSFCFSLSDGQATWAVVEGSQTGQRWLSGIIPLWNPPPPRK